MTQPWKSRPTDTQRVLRVLRGHRGRSQAITSKRLAISLGISQRKVRDAVAALVAQGYPIGASVAGKLGGYYWLSTQEEYDETMAILKARATEIWQRQRALQRSWQQQNAGPTQLAMTLDKSTQRRCHE